MIITELENTLVLFRRFYNEAQDKGRFPWFVADLGIEADRRLNQIIWLLKRIQLLESGSIMNDWRPGLSLTKEELAEWSERGDELHLMTEAFYYFAFRFIVITGHLIKGNRDYFKNRIKGIRAVRNQLIEHAEGKNGILSNSFSYGGINGPILKSARFEGEEGFSDLGVYTNAEELVVQVNMLLNEVLKLDKK